MAMMMLSVPPEVWQPHASSSPPKMPTHMDTISALRNKRDEKRA